MKLGIIIIRLLSIIHLFLLFAFVMHWEALVSFTSQLVAILGIVILFYSLLIDTTKKIDYIIILMYIFMVCCLSYSYELLMRVICFALMISTFDIGLMVRLDKKTINIITISYMIQAALLIIISFTPLAYSVDFVSDNGYYLALGFSNPNTTGVVLFSIIFTIVALLDYYDYPISIKHFRFKQLLIFCVLLLLVRLLFLTDSRTSLLICLISLLLFLFYKYRSNNKPFSRAMIFLIVSIPIIYYFIYVAYSKQVVFDEIEFMGKPLFSGREVIFEEIQAAWTNHWFGNADRFKFGNAHNSALSIVVSIGIVGFVMVLYYYVKRLFQYNERTCKSNMALLAILSFFIHGCNEAVMFTGGSIFYIYALNLCLLVRAKQNKTN